MISNSLVLFFALCIPKGMEKVCLNSEHFSHSVIKSLPVISLLTPSLVETFN